MVVGQNPGDDEEAKDIPFIGKTGILQEKTFFPLAGFTRSEVSLGNTIRCRVDGGNDLPRLDDPITQLAIRHCTQTHFTVPEQCSVIIAAGVYALWMLTGKGLKARHTLSAWRGYALPLEHPWLDSAFRSDIWTPGSHEVVVLPTIHIAALFRDPTMTYPTKRDWAKVRRVLAGTWPVALPEISQDAPEVWPRYSAFDTEYVVEVNGRPGPMTRYNLYDIEEDRLWVIENEGEIAPTIVPERPRVVMHNAEADIDFLEALINSSYTLEDTMYADSVLWSGLPHDLDFLGSLYATTNRWKHLDQYNPIVYAGADAVGTAAVWKALEAQFHRDPLSETAYRERRLPLIPIIHRGRQAGIRTDQARAKQAVTAITGRQQLTQAQAMASVGWPINLQSLKQVSSWLYDYRRFPAPRAKKKGKHAS